jgi:hypothetical protein
VYWRDGCRPEKSSNETLSFVTQNVFVTIISQYTFLTTAYGPSSNGVIICIHRNAESTTYREQN